MEIGIFTFWSSLDNYGQILQSFALQRYLNEQQGVHAEIIRYYEAKIPRRYKFLNWVKKMFLCIPVVNKFLPQKWRIEYERHFSSFKSMWINYSSHVSYGKKELNKFSSKYDILITGSDQVWSMLLNNANNSVYFLDFGNKYQRRISYAASFGMKDYPISLKSKLRHCLSKLDAVTVRELDGITICKSCGKKADLALDPTFLLDRKVYLTLGKSKQTVSFAYLYVLNVANKDDIYWDVLLKYIKTPRIIGTTASGYSTTQLKVDGVEYENSTIEQWLYNIANANIVITTSFHGVVFSIIFHKEFIFIPLQGGYSQSNNRVFDLLNNLGIENRIVSDKKSVEKMILNHIDYDKVEKKLEPLRKFSKSYLKTQLSIK